MKPLESLQLDFQDYLITAATEAKKHIAGTSDAFIEERLNIYRDSYRGRLQSMMDDDFSSLANYLGENAFHALCDEYLLQYPSQHFSIRYLGQHFPAFLQQHPSSKKRPELHEIALCDWHLLDISDVENIDAIDLSALQQIPQEQWADISFTVHPSVRIEGFHYAIDKAVTRFNENKRLQGVKKYSSTKYYLFARQNMLCGFDVLKDIDYIFMKHILAGENFSQVCEALLEHMDEEMVPQFALTAMVNAINRGLFTAISATPQQ